MMMWQMNQNEQIRTWTPQKGQHKPLRSQETRSQTNIVWTPRGQTRMYLGCKIHTTERDEKCPKTTYRFLLYGARMCTANRTRGTWLEVAKSD